MATMPINNAATNMIQLARTNPLHYTANGLGGATAADDAAKAAGGTRSSFEEAMLRAIDGVNADQSRSSDLIQQAIADPESVDAHQVTISMAEASLSLNLAKTILSRVVTAWKDVINTR